MDTHALHRAAYKWVEAEKELAVETHKQINNIVPKLDMVDYRKLVRRKNRTREVYEREMEKVWRALGNS